MMATTGRENLVEEVKFEVAVKSSYYLLSFFNKEANYKMKCLVVLV